MRDCQQVVHNLRQIVYNSVDIKVLLSTFPYKVDLSNRKDLSHELIPNGTLACG